MEIQRDTLRELQYLQEDIAAYFTDEHVVSGETYWTCVESVAIAKLAELRGEPLYYEKLKEVMESFLEDEDGEQPPQKGFKPIFGQNFFFDFFEIERSF